MTGRRFALAAKAFRELGPGQLWDYARYRSQLRLGLLRRHTGSPPPALSPEVLRISPKPIFPLPDRQRILDLLGDTGIAQLRDLADEIVAGKVRLFGGEAVPLQLETSLPLAHWTAYELGKVDTRAFDYKQVWEPARFGWGISLGRAYTLTGDERYVDAFWNYTEQFLQANPPYLGVQWVSAQEAALRLIALVFCHQVLRDSTHTTPGRSESLASAIAAHARRIPPSLSYARSQNNNHLISEAAGLYTAGIFLPNHPQAEAWRASGWRWLNRAFQSQIAADGAYVQHSANYQRLILHTALWVARISKDTGQPLPEASRQSLAAAARWLLALLDGPSGRVPNLGPNDGALLFPLANCACEDYRPTLQAAAAVFMGSTPLERGVWDELRLWLGEETSATSSGRSADQELKPHHQTPHRLDNPETASWAYLRTASFTSRPGHADQLHLDLWWRGYNLAQDAGSYLYNAPPPWDNALSRTAVHNTVTVDGLDQMTLAGRFLWLDWAQATLVEQAGGSGCDWERLTARHDGYRRLGLIHQRAVTCFQDGRWLVEDSLLPEPGDKRPSPEHWARPTHIALWARLHWLLPDWPWMLEEQAEGAKITLTSPAGVCDLCIRWGTQDGPGETVSISLARAGEMLSGAGTVEASRGWVSNTYAQQIPALSLAIEQRGRLPMHFTSEWRLP
jgi:hypothetical protein